MVYIINEINKLIIYFLIKLKKIVKPVAEFGLGSLLGIIKRKILENSLADITNFMKKAGKIFMCPD